VSKALTNISYAVRASLLLCLVVLSHVATNAQEGVITVGLQFKPMVPMKFIIEEPEVQTADEFSSEVAPRFGMSMGMVIRRGLNKMWSLESGINFVQRNFEMTTNHTFMPEKRTMNYRMISYEIPLQALVYVKLTDELYMNASGGVAFNFYPSNIETFDNERIDTTAFDFHAKTIRHSWLQFSLLANYGFEYRTKDKGYFYLGVSYSRPFTSIATSVLSAQYNRDPARMDHPLKGDYLTLDLRYFFHEKPERRIKK
jgi:hypothetical protein